MKIYLKLSTVLSENLSLIILSDVKIGTKDHYNQSSI